ncbi:unnamed protein product [Gongylonema pulchrum]|uniref:Ovule protein n=1 Tax=Gongylonema pulchrum TaxID=637853 RepID=A0A183DP64_9BILA|nr:unnamed protein product [Gongylonema pulchrum]
MLRRYHFKTYHSSIISAFPPKCFVQIPSIHRSVLPPPSPPLHLIMLITLDYTALITRSTPVHTQDL